MNELAFIVLTFNFIIKFTGYFIITSININFINAFIRCY